MTRPPPLAAAVALSLPPTAGCPSEPSTARCTDVPTGCSRRSSCRIVAGRSRGRCRVAAVTSGATLQSRRRQHRRCWLGYIGAGPYVAASRDFTAAIQV
jgi:hypothetical protein